MSDSKLTPERDVETRRIAAVVHVSSYDDFLHAARVLVSGPDDQAGELSNLTA